MIHWAFGVIGILALLLVLFKVLAALWRILWPYVLGRPKSLEALAGPGNWALVTGCTDGIGRAYAAELASRGISLVLVSRSAQKMAEMEAEFRRRFAKPDFLTVAFDFSEPSVAVYKQRLIAKIQHLPIGILVNNVGAIYSFPQRFYDANGGLEKMADVMTINMHPVTLLSAFVLEQMTKRGHGVIVNISSMIGYRPCFYQTIYAATKAYVNCLSQSLRLEYADQKGIHIQTICPGVVITNMSRMVSDGKSPSFFMPSAEKFARQAIRTIGLAKETTGYVGHQIQKELMFGMLPGFMLDSAIKKFQIKTQKEWLAKNDSPLKA